jgi:hypothetical protein
MKRGIIILAVALVALVVGIGYWVFVYTPKDFRPLNTAGYESDMTAALLTDLLQQVRTNEVAAFFVTFDHRLTPPTDAFLARFSGHQPPVKSFAAARVLPTGDILDKASGKVGVIVQIAAIEQKSAVEFDVEAAISRLPSNSNRFIYTVTKENATWKVKNRRQYEVK